MGLHVRAHIVLQLSIQSSQGGESRLGALSKVQYSEPARRMTMAAPDLLDSSGVARAAGLVDESATVWQDRFLFALGLRIAGGTHRDRAQHHRPTNPWIAERTPASAPRREAPMGNRACSCLCLTTMENRVVE